MSEIKVNKITPRTGTTITLGDSGDSLSIASGVALTDFTSTGIDDNATSTALTIDGSENVLIDKTSSNYQTTGHELRAGGRAFHTADGGKSLSLVRLTDDGPIMDLYNSSGNEIGQIGVDFTDNLFISGNSTHAGLNFGTASVVPYKNGANLDATIDWGSSATRFKDLYLSGSVYLGGTGSANALDDYEEGEYTPTVNLGSGSVTVKSDEAVLSYVKIGRMVLVTGQLEILSVSSPSGDLSITLPFANKSNATNQNSSIGVGGIDFIITSIAISPRPALFLGPDSSEIRIRRNLDSTGNGSPMGDSLQAATRIYFNLTYQIN